MGKQNERVTYTREHIEFILENYRTKLQLCIKETEYVNSKQHIESDCSAEPASEEFRKWIRYIHDLTSSVEKNGMLYGEKIGWREGKDGWEEITFNTIMANNCDGFKKLLFDLEIDL